MVAAGAASAQDLKAEIPFTFRAGGKTMAAGEYRVTMISPRTGGFPVYRISDGHQTALLMASDSHEAKREWLKSGVPVLAFQCGESRCSLTQLYSGGATPTYKFLDPSRGKDEPTHTTYVVMRPHTGD